MFHLATSLLLGLQCSCGCVMVQFRSTASDVICCGLWVNSSRYFFRSVLKSAPETMVLLDEARYSLKPVKGVSIIVAPAASRTVSMRVKADRMGA